MTDYDEGDWRTPTLTVSPADGTTLAVLTVITPAGVSSTPTVTSSVDGATWTGDAYELTAGSTIESWVVTGTGKGKQRNEVLVAPAPTDLPSGVRVYATTGDYAKATQEAPPAGLRRRLLEASREVDQMLLTAFYTVDDDGYPTDADVILAMRDATVAQAEYAAEIGDENMVGANQFHSVAIATVNLTRGYGPGGSTAPARWSAKAWQALQRAGLVGGNEPWIP